MENMISKDDIQKQMIEAMDSVKTKDPMEGPITNTVTINFVANAQITVRVGGGVKLHDLSELSRTGVDGFFVVSAITEADDPGKEAMKLVEAWKAYT